MISGVPHDTPENPHDFAIRPGSPAGPEGPSPSARRNGPAWASRARSASKWWVQPPNRTSAQPASMVERLADMADMAGPADVTLRHMQRCDFDWFPEHKLSTYQTYHYFQWDFIPFSLFLGCMGVLYAETAQAVSFFVRIISPRLVTSILSPMVHSTMRPVSRTNHEMAVTKSRLRT